MPEQQKQIFSNNHSEENNTGAENTHLTTKSKINKNFKFNFSPIKFLLLTQILLSILIKSTLCNLDYSKYLLKIDEKKLKKAIKKYDYFFLFIDYPECLQCSQLEPELGGTAYISRLENLKVRFFQINFLENENFLKNYLDIRTLPQLYFFDNKLNYKFPLNLEMDFSYLPRIFKKLSGKFNMTNMETADQLNEIHYGKKNMIFLFNKEKSEAFNVHGKEIRNFVRLSIVAGYDTFYYCNKKLFFEHFIKSKKAEFEFNEDSFFFLTGPIKNVTMQQVLEKDSEIVYDENAKEDQEIQGNNMRRKKASPEALAEDEDKAEFKRFDSEKEKLEETKENEQKETNSTESSENVFLKPYNFFKIDIAKLKQFQSEIAKQEFLLENFLHFKFNAYSSLGHAELSDVIETGIPTLIVFGPRNFINEQKDFHREMFYLSKKYEKKIKFYYSTLDSQYAKYFARILNLRHSELPVFFLIEKNHKEKNDFNKFKLAKAQLSKEAIEKFIDDYFTKKLKFYFVSQTQLDVTEETLKEALAALNETATDDEMNKKYYNAGRNIYQIEGRHFESFMLDNLNKTVVVMACSFPMINCRNGLEKLRFVTKTFNNFMDKVIFVETDPNFNEYVVSIKNPSDFNDSNNSNDNNTSTEPQKIYTFNDYFRYIFKPLYPQVVLFPALPQDEEKQTNLNNLIIKKLQSSIEFKEDIDCMKLIKFVGKNAQIPPEQVQIDIEYIKNEDVDGNIKLTADYDEDFFPEDELDKDSDLDAKMEDLKEMLGPDAAALIDLLSQQNSKQSNEIKKELAEAVEEMKRNENIEPEAPVSEEKFKEEKVREEEISLKEKDDL